MIIEVFDWALYWIIRGGSFGCGWAKRDSRCGAIEISSFDTEEDEKMRRIGGIQTHNYN